MSDTVIRVENLSKKYILGHQKQESYTTLRDSISNGAKGILNTFRRGKYQVEDRSVEDFWALKDVSFEIKQGDRVGIIGRNGAGKSTLLKILSRIVEPTKGSIRIKGRVSSLLEVGTGFHPELTGRENITLNGAILGMSKADIDLKFDEIVAFAEVEDFLDTPVKRYSSGMYVRLAFSVAAHLDPEILIVDEVLAVGDAAFQKKCLGKMNSITSEGRTIIFVSHNITAVRKLCTTGILLEKGNIVKIGNAESVLKTYVETGMSAQYTYELPLPKDRNIAGYAQKLTVEDIEGNPISSIHVGKPWQVRVSFTISRNIENFVIGLGIVTSDELPLRTSWSYSYSLESGEYEAVFREDLIILGTGGYSLVVGLSEQDSSFYYVENAGILEISELSEGIELMKVSSVGSVLNPMNVSLFNSRSCIVKSS